MNDGNHDVKWFEYYAGPTIFRPSSKALVAIGHTNEYSIMIKKYLRPVQAPVGVHAMLAFFSPS